MHTAPVIDLPALQAAARTVLTWSHRPIPDALRDSHDLVDALATLDAVRDAPNRLGRAVHALHNTAPDPDREHLRHALRDLATALNLPLPANLERYEQLALL
jgi:hypothetical protein